MEKDRYIRFDWAIKRLLRTKANFGVLEGLLTVLLNEKIQIVEILESEGNQESESDKFNRVDIKARNSKGEKRGLEKGLAEGEKKSRFEIARNMCSMGMATDAIVQITGLSAKEIERLK